MLVKRDKRTPQVPNKRMGKPEEIADAIVFLASDKPSCIIAACLAVDEGMTAVSGL